MHLLCCAYGVEFLARCIEDKKIPAFSIRQLYRVAKGGRNSNGDPLYKELLKDMKCEGAETLARST